MCVYDSDYMNKFKSIYSVNEKFINNNQTVISLQSKEFYVKMGATPCGEVESLLRKGLKLASKIPIKL
ncbi:hypothetical protein SAMN02745163_00840 [Clostridium cavendishii DSM 21758]|uniref:Uncharacterized protein n=1 Tax=Clostridium cavendishii DSM 21758 TaxID=1121302 RepID=A0A1M6EF90_9CLOT|nr:hypothetical protein [Clostridium cavendishii]SHI84111.1 hypothetical protein SAMN02745163_00840 [Clostridium cavendishii DSM 21758]